MAYSVSPVKARVAGPVSMRYADGRGPLERRRASGKAKRMPLGRERILDAAIAIADAKGLDALSMRSVGARLGVEAMSLYKHVANKEAILDGMIDRVMSEMALPSPGAPLRNGLVARATDMRRVLLRHPWAAMLVESRTTPTPARLAYHDASLRLLRDAGVPIALAYHAILALDSYVYGFVAQEVWWPFAADERPELIDTLAPSIDPDAYPHLVEMMAFVAARSIAPDARTGYDADFAVGLGMLLDGFFAALPQDATEDRARRRVSSRR